MRKLNFKNRIFIILFCIIIVGIIGLLIFAARKSSDKVESLYTVTSNTVLFGTENNLLDTKLGGAIEKNWSGNYYYNTSDQKTYLLGKKTIIFEKLSEDVTILGGNYQILSDGSVVQNSDIMSVSSSKASNFYKIADREYLIVANEIYTQDKSIYVNKYLIVYLDVQGNASILNDAVNIKTINPITLIFGDYSFDVANEKLVYKEKTIDLKQVEGSTNQYTPSTYEKKPELNDEEFIDKYNKLVNNFDQYVDNHALNTGGNNQASITNNNIVINGGSSSDSGSTSENNTPIYKKVSLRGTISYPTYIDVTYMVTDPNNSYQSVYLLVVGDVDGTPTTQKILLDKYATTYRITGLTPSSEYTISLGYVEVYVNSKKEKELIDNIEDVINVRTTRIDARIDIEKISNGYVYYNFKMSNAYAFESAFMSLYIDGVKQTMNEVDCQRALSSSGFSDRFKIDEGTVYELVIEYAKYNGNDVNVNINRKFSY